MARGPNNHAAVAREYRDRSNRLTLLLIADLRLMRLLATRHTLIIGLVALQVR